MPDSVGAALAACRLSAQLEPEQRRKIEAMAEPRRFRKGQVVFRQDEKCPGLFVVAKGAVRIFKVTPAGKEHVLQIVAPGQTFAKAP